jgi:uncharacterized protein (TIGR02569 family)
MDKEIPDLSILAAFDVSEEPVLLPGGGGTCYRVENIVLKPTGNAIETSWLSEINNSLSSSKFRIPKPIRATDGSWVFHGWSASEFLPGEPGSDNYAEAMEVCKEFHRAVKDIPEPAWFAKKSDVFSLSDRMAWGEIPLPDFEPAKKIFENVSGFLNENRLPFQLIHGDWGPSQLLFHDELPPAVLDMTPYFRPADYSIADMLIGAVVYFGEDVSILDMGKDIKDIDQLLLRAFVFRTCTYIGLQIHPENEYDWTSEIVKYINAAESILDKICPQSLRQK